jgi:hypothetical protein
MQATLSSNRPPVAIVATVRCCCPVPMDAAADVDEATLTISDQPKAQYLNGVPFIASASVDLLMTGLTLYGMPGRLRVSVTRDDHWLQRLRTNKHLAWDWRCFVEVLDVKECDLSQPSRRV